jgi:CRISPR-associated protein Csa3
MKTYISLSGFDTSQIISLMVKYGIERGDRLILLRPEEEKDSRGESTVQAIKDLSRQIDSSIEVDIHRVDHRDFEGMVISLIDLLKNAEGQVVVNLSGGPREIFLGFVVACLSQSQKIFKTTNFSDIDRTMNEIVLPNITNILDDRLKRILKDVDLHQPTTITEIAKRLKSRRAPYRDRSASFSA